MNSKHRNIKFTVEREENNSLSFLEIKIFCDNGNFQISVYRNSAFSCVLTNFEFHPYCTNIVLFPLC